MEDISPGAQIDNKEKDGKQNIFLFLVLVCTLLLISGLIYYFYRSRSKIYQQASKSGYEEIKSAVTPFNKPEANLGVQLESNSYFTTATVTGLISRAVYREGNLWYVDLAIKDDPQEVLKVMIGREGFSLSVRSYTEEGGVVSVNYLPTPLREIIPKLVPPNKISLGVDFNIDKVTLDERLQDGGCDSLCREQVQLAVERDELNQEAMNKYNNGESVNNEILGPASNVEFY